MIISLPTLYMAKQPIVIYISIQSHDLALNQQLVFRKVQCYELDKYFHQNVNSQKNQKRIWHIQLIEARRRESKINVYENGKEARRKQEPIVNKNPIIFPAECYSRGPSLKAVINTMSIYCTIMKFWLNQFPRIPFLQQIRQQIVRSDPSKSLI